MYRILRLLQQMSHLYQDSPSCPDECLPGSVSLWPQVVRVVVKLRCVTRVLEEGGEGVCSTQS